MVVVKLLGICAIVAVGWGVARTRLLGEDEAARTLSNLAFFVFTPALLWRTTTRIDLDALPWRVLAVFFGPVVALLLVVYVGQRARRPRVPAAPSVRAISTTFGNTVQLGIPIVTALFGAAGLTILVAIISVHALILLTTATMLAELDLARAAAAEDRPGLTATLAVTARRALVHPVILPVLLGLIWNLVGLPTPGPVDDVLATLGQAVVPVCLVVIGVSLSQYGLSGVVAAALAVSAGKLLLQPAAVFAAAYWAGGLRGTALAVVVLCAALPVGSNALLFAQRYEALEGETTAGVVASTLAFAVTGAGWLWLTTALAG